MDSDHVTDVLVDGEWLTTRRSDLVGFHDLLATDGLTRGLIGPREVPRLWPRHLDNCLAVADPELGLLPSGSRVVDIGSGAGLPGLVWALARPDIRVTLMEPLQRRTRFLRDAVARLALEQRVDVIEARAQDCPPVGADVATSRALAALTTVVEWSLRHLRWGGSLVAMKGGKASAELAEARETIDTLGGRDARVVRVGPIQSDGHPMATVVYVRATDGRTYD